MQVMDFLQVENVFVGLKVGSKNQLLRWLADKAAEKTGISSATLSKALVERESLGSTGIGEGVAIPHATVPGLTHSICMFAKLDKPVGFEAVDDVPVDLVVLLLTPSGEKGEALNVLSCVARRFRDEGIVRHLRLAWDPADVFALLTS